MFGKASSSQTLSANKKSGSFLSVDCRIVFPRDLRNGMSFSQNGMPFTSSSPAAVPYLLLSMARDKADGKRGDLLQKIDRAFG